MHTGNVEILECTLRDGSYAIDFQFTPKDTVVIAAALENAGFDLIEVGHGVGMNASNAGKGIAAATDEEYMQAAATALKHAQWGMFFIPGIGRHEDLELAASCGMGFVRVGTNATEVKQSKEYVEHAKKLGLFVSANLMKSYALPPMKLAVEAKLSEKFGTDLVCLVDSAGCMLPDDVRDYMAAMLDVLTVPVGLHCHDNLALGIANVLTAIDCGAQRVDSTLQGMGRGGGNPVTEILLAVLKKRGIDLGIDLNRTMDISERLVKPMLKDKGYDPINISCGYAGFHSSFLKTILKYADLYKVDARDLIVAVCEVDRVYAPEDLVEDMARQLQRRPPKQASLHLVSLPCFSFPSTDTGETSDGSLRASTRKLAKNLKAIAKKKGGRSVLNIVAAPQPVGKATVSRFAQEQVDYVIGSIEVDNSEQLKEVVEAVDGIVDILLVDLGLRSYLDNSLLSLSRVSARQSHVFGYNDNDVWVRSVDRRIGAMLQDVRGHHVTVYGTDDLALRLTLSLMEQGAEVTLTSDEPQQLESSEQALKQMLSGPISLKTDADPIHAARGADVLVKFSRQQPLMSRSMVDGLAPNGIVFDAGIGSVSAEAIAYANENGIRVVRPDMRAALASELTLLMGTQRTVRELMGRGEIVGVSVVGGGLIGQYGDVVVDSVSNPSKVVGVADGRGAVIYEARPQFEESLLKVETEILRKKILAE